MNQKNILCFGDSNTWGCNPADSSRFDRHTRWPGVLQQELGTAYHIIEEGLGGRTTVWDDPVEGDKNGLLQLRPILHSHQPLDLVIIMLGTNDLKGRFSVSAFDVSHSIGRLVKVVRQSPYSVTQKTPQVLVICPPPFADLSATAFRDMFVGGEEKSHQLAQAFKNYCAECQIPFLNAGDIIHSSALDGIHLDASEHTKLATAVAAKVQKLI